MSVTMAKNDGVTVFTIQSDPNSRWPPVCQILKSLCYSPLCCSVSRNLTKTKGKPYSVLGAIQIMVGLLNLGFGGILRASPDTDWRLNNSEFPYWLGALFITCGAMCVLCELFPSLCLVILNVILSLAGVGVAIAAIVLYSVYIGRLDFYWYCGVSDHYQRFYHTPDPTQDGLIRKICLEASLVAKVILIGLNVLLIILSIVQLCAVFTSAVVGIKALRNSGKVENLRSDDVECIKPLQGEVAVHPAV